MFILPPPTPICTSPSESWHLSPCSYWFAQFLHIQPAPHPLEQCPSWWRLLLSYLPTPCVDPQILKHLEGQCSWSKMNEKESHRGWGLRIKWVRADHKEPHRLYIAGHLCFTLNDVTAIGGVEQRSDGIISAALTIIWRGREGKLQVERCDSGLLQ